MRAPIIERGVLLETEIAELRAFGDELFAQGGYDKVAVNAHRAATVQQGILLSGLYGSNTYQVSFEIATDTSSPLSEIPQKAAAFIRRLTNKGDYTNMGFNYFLGDDASLLTQVPHVDSGYSEVFTLSGAGGVRIFPEGQEPYDIECSAGDWVTRLRIVMQALAFHLIMTLEYPSISTHLSLCQDRH